MKLNFDLSKLTPEEILIFKKALVKLNEENEPEPKLTKEEADLRLELVNIVLDSMRRIMELLDSDLEPYPLERESTLSSDELISAAGILMDMDKYVRTVMDDIDPVYFRTNPKGKKAAEHYVLLAFGNACLIAPDAQTLDENNALRYLKLSKPTVEEIRKLADEIYEFTYGIQEWNEDLAKDAQFDFLHGMLQ